MPESFANYEYILFMSTRTQYFYFEYFAVALMTALRARKRQIQ